MQQGIASAMATERPVAIVTGASSGFGLGASIALARHGYLVIATMRDTGKKGPLLEQSERLGIAERVVCCELDVTNEARATSLAAQAAEGYGRIDVLLNNAGFAVAGFVEDIGMDAWRRQFETNLFGAVAMTKAVLPAMRARRSGRIINIGSVSGRFGFPAMGPYAASKFALEGFSESLRLELLPFGVYVSLIEPGAYKTNIWNTGSFSMPPDSPYGRQAQAMLREMRRTADTAGDPDEVVQRIVRIATSKKPPKLRYPVGRGVRRNMALKALLPWSWIELAVSKLLK
ncbi:short-chain dehydrogenase [Gordoniibacillus kamchatkensis]|uniref:Short-chain dehydrogenase n=1 Tax=Gordoniibacillus kamchatkensis TaxID=1590651 RepID=A0ABR5AI86_9BACL|nr:short-chain dehydrogenase [Paenibacillus sp. VKM B-2647]